MNRHTSATHLVLATLTLLVPGSLAGQTVLVRVTDEDSAAPVASALVRLLQEDRAPFRTLLSDERGRALFLEVPDGSYVVRVEMIGAADYDSAPFSIRAGEVVSRTVALASQAIALEGLKVDLTSGRCTRRPQGEGQLVARLWDEAQKALETAALTTTTELYRYEVLRYVRRINRDSGEIEREEREERAGFMRTPFESRAADDLVENGFVQGSGTEELFFAPDAAVLLADEFLDTHCFRLAVQDEDRFELVGLGFEPVGNDRSVADIAGTMWLDATTAELRWIEFGYQYLEPEREAPEVGGRVDFERMPDGTWIVREWWIRMPVMAIQADFRGNPRRFISAFEQNGGLVIDVRSTGGPSLTIRARTGAIGGAVRDSLGQPIQGARLGVVGSNQEVFTNAQGEYEIVGLPAGRYQVRVRTPLGEAAASDVDLVVRDVLPGEVSRLDYHEPALSDMLTDACAGEVRPEDTAILSGTVVDPRGVPIEGALVRVGWREFDFTGVTAGRRASDLRAAPLFLEALTDGRGRYLYCSVPARSVLQVTAVHEELTSGVVETVIPAEAIGRLVDLRLVRSSSR